jgi:hypothetical protein
MICTGDNCSNTTDFEVKSACVIQEYRHVQLLADCPLAFCKHCGHPNLDSTLAQVLLDNTRLEYDRWMKAQKIVL